MIEIYTPIVWDEFISMGLEMHRESSYRDISFEKEKIRKMISLPGVVCFLYKIEEKYVGFFLGGISPYYFSNELAARDIAFFVSPEHRGGFAAVRLIREFEKWAKCRNVSDVYLSQSTGVYIESTKSLYERLGYQILGSSAKKRI